MKLRMSLFMTFGLLTCNFVQTSEQKGAKEMAVKKQEILIPGDVLRLLYDPKGFPKFQAIIAEHPEYINAKHEHRSTLLSTALEAKNIKAVVFLLEHGARITDKELELTLIQREWAIIYNDVKLQKQIRHLFALFKKYADPSFIKKIGELEKDVVLAEVGELVGAADITGLLGEYAVGPKNKEKLLHAIELSEKRVKNLEVVLKIPEENKKFINPARLLQIEDWNFNDLENIKSVIREENKQQKNEIDADKQNLEKGLNKEKVAELDEKVKSYPVQQVAAIQKKLNEYRANLLQQKQQLNAILLNEMVMSIRDNNLPAVQALIKDYPELLSLKDEAGNMPLQIAQKWDRKEIVAFLEHPLKEKEELKKKATAKVQAKKLQEFFAAIEKDDIKLTQEYIRAWGDVNVADAQGITPLMVASKAGNPTLVRLLLHAKANANAKDVQGNTALYYAANQGNPDVVHELLDYMSPENVNAYNVRHLTAYDVAKTLYEDTKMEMQRVSQMAEKRIEKAKKAKTKKEIEKTSKAIMQRYQDKISNYERIIQILERYFGKNKEIKKE